MNWKEMSPKKRQNVLLIGVGGITVLVLIVQFVLFPVLDSIQSTQKKAADLRSRIENNEPLLQREPQTRQNHADAVRAWQSLMQA
ncbi:MAG: hypothetical protein U1E27_11980, partial [Kiritimatiellia bacterium]|nr:hypothetical protein [Kiritimatiellia bacterium]